MWWRMLVAVLVNRKIHCLWLRPPITWKKSHKQWFSVDQVVPLSAQQLSRQQHVNSHFLSSVEISSRAVDGWAVADTLLLLQNINKITHKMGSFFFLCCAHFMSDFNYVLGGRRVEGRPVNRSTKSIKKEHKWRGNRNTWKRKTPRHLYSFLIDRRTGSRMER